MVSGTPYAFQVAAPSAVCVPDAFEPNDSWTTPSPNFGNSEELTLCPGDADWYSTYVPAGSQLEFWLFWDFDEGALDLVVYDAAGVELVRGTPTGPGDLDTLLWPVPAGGTYLVEVQPVTDIGLTPGVPYGLALEYL